MARHERYRSIPGHWSIGGVYRFRRRQYLNPIAYNILDGLITAQELRALWALSRRFSMGIIIGAGISIGGILFPNIGR